MIWAVQMTFANVWTVMTWHTVSVWAACSCTAQHSALLVPPTGIAHWPFRDRRSALCCRTAAHWHGPRIWMASSCHYTVSRSSMLALRVILNYWSRLMCGWSSQGSVLPASPPFLKRRQESERTPKINPLVTDLLLKTNTFSSALLSCMLGQGYRYHWNFPSKSASLKMDWCHASLIVQQESSTARPLWPLCAGLLTKNLYYKCITFLRHLWLTFMIEQMEGHLKSD